MRELCARYGISPQVGYEWLARCEALAFMPSRPRDPEYPAHFEVRYVSRNGGVRWHNRWVNVSHVLAEEYVGLEEVEDGRWSVYVGPVLLGRFDERDYHIHGAHNRTKL